MNTPLARYEKKSLHQRGSAFFRDIGLAIRNIPELRYLFTRNQGETPRRPETSPGSYESRHEALEALIEIVVPRFWPVRREPYSRGTVASEGLGSPYAGEMWLFVNGVASSSAVVKANGKELARIFQRPIHLVHNPTDSLALDLGESLLGRTFDFKTDLSRYLLDIVCRALVGYSRVVLIGHSQGGIFVANVANSLVRSYRDRERLANLEIYTFASAADEMLADPELSAAAHRSVPYYEHFANGHDFVARFGAIGCEQSIAGPLYVDEKRTGHLLNTHYLSAFEEGAYCGGKSRLFQYSCGGQPPDFAATTGRLSGVSPGRAYARRMR